MPADPVSKGLRKAAPKKPSNEIRYYSTALKEGDGPASFVEPDHCESPGSRLLRVTSFDLGLIMCRLMVSISIRGCSDRVLELHVEHGWNVVHVSLGAVRRF